ncbi:OmpA family protein [Maribius pontilimi]|uniref:OmpA family protein n=2 Tax=Palleronia pontilimi TaxID=1964209 RepID=A0A934I8N1_9RHOB|nr:OmpA family protein [Palleronia pontilimi]
MGRAALMAAVAATATLSAPLEARAQQRAVGTIWIDPDGCEHWVRDDGWEGYASNRLTRKGTPVCHKVETCGVMNSDVLFATDSARLGRQGRQMVANFFQQSGSRAYTIIGHTDSRASDSYNLRLSYNRANAVAKVAASVGARINDIRGYGERRPAASNQTAAGMQKNRRVEILCIR